MPITARVPPGRAGRIWLRRRLATAYRGRDQLDRKLRILLPELGRQRIRAARSHDDWETACAQSRRWTTRVALLSGQDAFRHAAGREPTRVDLTWATSMGVSYPATVAVSTPDEPAAIADNAAVVPAIAATRVALLAAVQTAAADEAVRRIEAEIAVTRRRLHALDKRWLPWLTAALADLELALEQAEHEDGIRIRRAGAGSRGVRRAGPVPEPSEGRRSS
jgi:V/A-type H+-transporting ATPase subunit D